MSIELQAAAGLLTGLFTGLAFGLLRPLLAVAIAGAAVYLAALLAFSGPPAIAALFGRLGTGLAAYPVFFSAMAAAKGLGCALTLRR